MFIFKIENLEEYYRKKIPNYFFSFNINRFFSLIKKNLIVMFLVCIFFQKKFSLWTITMSLRHTYSGTHKKHDILFYFYNSFVYMSVRTASFCKWFTLYISVEGVVRLEWRG